MRPLLERFRAACMHEVEALLEIVIPEAVGVVSLQVHFEAVIIAVQATTALLPCTTVLDQGNG